MQELEQFSHPCSSELPALSHVESKITMTHSGLNHPVTLSSPGRPRDGGTGLRIVIADGQTIFRESLRMLLQMGSGFDVIGGSSDAVATLDVVRNLQPDILLLDSSLPREDGTDLLAELRQLEAGVKVILLCHTISQEEMIRALRLGVRGIVLKTDPTDCLIECIEKVMRGEYWLGTDGLRHLIQAVCSFGNVKRSVTNRFGLTPREIEMIEAVLEGYSNPEIAANFSLSEQTVKHHLSHIFDKLGVYSRLELALFAVNHGLNSE